MNRIEPNIPVNSVPLSEVKAQAAQREANRSPVSSGSDSVELSNTARELASGLSSTQLDRVARIRSEIASGEFETPSRIEGTVDALLGVIG